MVSCNPDTVIVDTWLIRNPISVIWGCFWTIGPLERAAASLTKGNVRLIAATSVHIHFLEPNPYVSLLEFASGLTYLSETNDLCHQK